MNKIRVKKLEKINKINSPYITPKLVNLHNGVYTTPNDEILTRDKDGNFLFEDGTVYFDVCSVPDNQICLIIRNFV